MFLDYIYRLPKGTPIHRYTEDLIKHSHSWSVFVTTKDAFYTTNDVDTFQADDHIIINIPTTDGYSQIRVADQDLLVQ